ncbi:MAG: cytochrome P450 [Chitinophagaceae bacterium]
MQAQITNQVNIGTLPSATITMNQLPGPAGVPLLGNLLQITPEKLHRVIEKWSDQYGSIFKFKLGTIPVVVITAPETIQYVLKNRPEKFRRLGKMDDIIREMGVFGVFNAEGDDWKRQRKLVSQALNITNLKTFFSTLDHITEKLLNRWNQLSAQNTSVEIKGELMRYTVDITSRLAFGYDMNTLEKKEDIIQNHLEIIFPALFKRINSPVPYWRYVKLPADRRLEKSLKVIHTTMQGIIDQTREQLVHNPGLIDHPSNFLQALLAASDQEQPVSNEVVIGNVLTMLMAGEDTTAYTIAWIFYFMHICPEVQQKMQEEADLVLANENTIKNYDDVARLPYIEAVALEAMRLKPVAPIFFLDTLVDVVVEGTLVPKGTGVIAQSQFAAAKEEHFSNPEKFIPERWIKGGCPAHNVHNERAFLPFGAGPRFCPGYNLALLEMKAVLAMVCKNFTVTMVTPPENVHEIMAFTMMPSSFFVKFDRRKGV